MAAFGDERELGAVADCPSGWFDGTKSHVCKQAGPHTDHKCAYCSAVYDPAVRLVASEYGGVLAVRDGPAAP